MATVQIRGAQGRWEAEVKYDDGRTEVLACVHEYFWKKARGGVYHDPLEPETREMPKFQRQVELIKEKRRVILTRDKVKKTTGLGAFERTGYIAVYAIEDFVIDEDGMRMRFVTRIANARR